ncbi:MAG: hypothetical protein HY271_04925 [Deltaproteobacteria bacterium]|nr:hypothetical protein [Deltaproteobacteria bacterium]
MSATTVAVGGHVLAVLTTVLILAIVWAQPQPSGDLYIALAGGREILAGRLGTPDDWAFTTGGRVWLDQNWGAHLLLYGTHAVFGDAGLLVLKALLLVAVLAGLAWACRERGVDPLLALVVAAGAVGACRSYLELRPNLVSLALAPLFLWALERTRAAPGRVWLVVAIVALWANVHGGFTLALVLLILWTGAVLMAQARRDGMTAACRRAAPLFAATVTAVALAALATPFPIANLTHPLVVAESPLWQTVAEWEPVFGATPNAFGTIWEFLLFVGILAGVTLLRAVAALRSGRRAVERAPDALAMTLFDACSAVLLVAMAVRARRFIPFAIVLLAPLLAGELQELVGRRRRWPTLVLAAALLAGPILVAGPLVLRYRPDNPAFPRESLFTRMTGSTPQGVARFLDANAIAGAAFTAWEWEGFLRWQGTGLRFLIGGRAQQVYDESTYRLEQELLVGNASTAARLDALGVRVAALPLIAKYSALLGALVYGDEPRWAFVYCDGRHAVLADTHAAETAALTARAARGVLRYPDEASAALSRAMYLASPAVAAETSDVDAAARAATALRPSGMAYSVLGDLALADRIPRAEALAYLEAEHRRLAALPTDAPNAVEMLRARRTLLQVLAALLQAAGREREAATAAREQWEIGMGIAALLQHSAYGGEPYTM